uniref:Uncharacterized protein n=1 Tax=Fagus sylvatica TaxID=28930 RepID=A0A2N9GCK0_FAGSY
MRGGRGLIYRRACTPRARHHGARRVWWRASRAPATWHSYPSTPAAPRIFLGFRAHILFDPIFEGNFGGLSELKMGHAAYLRKALDVLFPTIPVKRGMLFGEPRVPRRSWSHYLSNAPGLADQLVASRKDSAREGGSPDVGFRRSWYRRKACVAYFCKVPGFAEIRAWVVRYGPREQRPPEVFLVRLRAVFRSGIPARPGKILAIREFHVVHECVFFPTCPGLQDQLVASQEDSARKRGNVGGKIPELSAKPYFIGLFSRAWPCTEASLGSQDMILRTEAVGMFLMPRGHLLIEIPA